MEMKKGAELIMTKELRQGKEIANQLRDNLNDPSLLLLSTPQTASREDLLLLVQKLLSSLEKALSMLQEPPHQPPPPAAASSQAPNRSPKSEVCDNNNSSKERDVYKRRKTMPRWSEQVRICTSSGLEGPADDGYSWRKYGQKDILGALHPRAYYRCTHRPVQGCLATKQVQKSDQDPSVFEITYRGRHTCTQQSRFTPPKLSESETDEAPKKQEEPEPMIRKQQTDQEEEEKLQHHPPFPPIFAGLTVKTEGLDTNRNTFPPFSFPYTPPEILDDQDDIFSTSIAMHDDPFLNSYFISPATSDSGYFSPCNVENFGMCQNSDSDFTEILSAPANSITNSPIGDELDLTIDESLADFDPSSMFTS